MNSLREFEGRTVEKAIDAALQELDIPREELDYNVVTKGSAGLFGLFGAKKAKISVTLKQTRAKQGRAAKSLVDEAFGTPKSEERTTAESDGFKGEDRTYEYTERTFEEGFFKGLTPAEAGVEILKEIASFISEESEIAYSVEGDILTYNVTGGNAAVMIGKKGQTLEAIQYLLDKIINKHSMERVRVQVDIEGYLEMRKEKLRQHAQRMAEKVKKTGKPHTIGHMSSHDRRIIHLTLKDDRGVRTQSMGEGYYRRLVIFPKRNKGMRNKNR
ncbi:RNA-binding cell elongation regulator Jag/EloR [Desulfoluna butyratoxydans]|uniref:RNA-binding protein KhpB n=1 Tax=Desulfoluna butyratoxydans TaxID=231438 RepID=A0A4U8YKA4_9BACT|nr:RNA-binding cell elongation regulator Jag/EloR [Desulfoluna butyratoxydans]VFQ43794.1 jag n-terminus [Desulfoluna butyratoxydans]